MAREAEKMNDGSRTLASSSRRPEAIIKQLHQSCASQQDKTERSEEEMGQLCRGFVQQICHWKVI